MKENILGLRTVTYKVPDLAAAKEWYTKAFRTAPYFDEAYYVGYNIGGYELGLMPDKVEGTNNGSVIAYWGVEDIEAVYRHFLDTGATVDTAPDDVGGGISVAVVKDPWSNVIGLIYNPHFKATP